jgi:predicted molibdopterin-dependent oxidoreductase YjgC
MTDRHMIIDGKKVDIKSADKNIVDVAKRNKIALPAPCYLSNRVNGCCRVCVVEISGKQKYACTTTPENDLEVIVNRSDLNALRKERIVEYQQGKHDSTPCDCGCSCSDSNCC